MRGPNLNRPTTWGYDPNPNSNPNRLTGREFFWKVALTCIPDPNRSTAINFVDVNGIFIQYNNNNNNNKIE